MMKKIFAAALLAAVGAASSAGAADAPSVRWGSTIEKEALELTSEWDKTFPKSDAVHHEKVTFHNRYGITLAADLYRPRRAAANARLAAIAVCGPFGAVKEQC